ncbi:MAG: hypothetical protein IJJ29_06850 [Solobacterium sp.]|nr:hypothetical protein [Solobacterium sp.]
MSLSTNLIMGAIFLALGIWLTIGVVRTRSKLTITDKMWNASRILFAIAGGLSIVSFFSYEGPQDFLRIIPTTYAIFIFLLLRDGIGETGFASFGKFTKWEDVRAYDYSRESKKFVLYVSSAKEDGRTTTGSSIPINFDPKDEQRVIDFMKEHLPKKYRRMRKG